MFFLVIRTCGCIDCCCNEAPQRTFYAFNTERDARGFINDDCASAGYTASYALHDSDGLIVESRFPVLMVA